MPKRKMLGATPMNPFSFRTTADLRAKLEAAALASGHSLSHEIETRLQQSFDQPALIDALAERLEARAERSRRSAFSRAEYDSLPDVFRRHLPAPDEHIT